MKPRARWRLDTQHPPLGEAQEPYDCPTCGKTHGKPRLNQLTPEGDWYVWLMLAGRGWGKTRTGAEDVAWYGLTHPLARVAIVAPTYTDARDTCVEGESGLFRVLPPDAVLNWNRSLGELILKNGTRYKLFSADKPDRLRGPQHHRAWCDELAAWEYPEAWDMLMMGLRLGDDPRAIVTTTPRPVQIVRELVKRRDRDVHVTTGSTFENAANLAGPALEQLKAKYEGTRLGRQELYAELLEDMPGALWKRSDLDEYRVEVAPGDQERVVVAIDPAVTSEDTSDETGIVVACRGTDGHGYVMEDLSMRDSPDAWARRAVQAFHDYKADHIVVEVNQGGDLIESVIRTFDPNIPISHVHASRGKVTRAEPVSALYEQGRIHHVGTHALLEDQMCMFVPGDLDKLGFSPDRVDALVWAFWDLMLLPDDGTVGWTERKTISPF